MGIVSMTYEFSRSRPTDLSECVDFPLKPDSADHKSPPSKPQHNYFPDNPDKVLTPTRELYTGGFQQCLVTRFTALQSIHSGAVLPNTKRKLHNMRRSKPQLKLHHPQWQLSVDVTSSSLPDGIISIFFGLW